MPREGLSRAVKLRMIPHLLIHSLTTTAGITPIIFFLLTNVNPVHFRHRRYYDTI